MKTDEAARVHHAVGGAAAAWPLAARAQQPKRMRLIGVLMGYAESDPAAQSWFVVFRGELSKLGWTEGSNLRIELRWGAADPDKIKTLAKELVNLPPDAILSVTTPVTGVLAHETRTLPIVFAVVADPIAGGFVASLGHPGGNITGFTTINSALGGKWVELLKEIAPHTVRMALLFNPATAPPLRLPFKPQHPPLPSKRVPHRFTSRMRSKALSLHKRAIQVAASS